MSFADDTYFLQLFFVTDTTMIRKYSIVPNQVQIVIIASIPIIWITVLMK